MKYSSYRRAALPLLALTLGSASLAQAGQKLALRHEIWLIDQSNTYDSDGNGSLDSGGNIHIYRGEDFKEAGNPNPVVETISLGGANADYIKQVTGTAPVRPHYISFNKSGTHALITFVATGHLIIIEAATRQIVYAVDVGVQAHASNPSPDEDYILVANQNGKLVQRIDTDYATNTFSLDNTATLDLANGLTPSGAPRESAALRPDNAAIITYPEQTKGDLAFVTLRGGGAFVVTARTTPITIVAEYTQEFVEPAGLIAVQKDHKLYFNSGGGGGATIGYQSVLYTLPWKSFSAKKPILTPNSPSPKVVFDHGPTPVTPETRGRTDSHGLVFTPHKDHLWVVDRADNRVIVVDPDKDKIVNEILLGGAPSADPAPDLIRFSPDGDRAYASLRGPNPLTGNNPAFNNAVGLTPGLGVIDVRQRGKVGKLLRVIPTTNKDATGVERSDPHGIHIRKFRVPVDSDD
ncbi:hypothetical protein OJ996_22555 [Luteolibacter sp. GHJ8]|uniref:DNA-binding beta-propeller fold protein YncE n=1 Tax=Luteolibacter rhizosphaerae TaxID=2989719 RepID=A0ABT3G967_9BACT|nr:hypothetical protein [Luteolibacter rhizosphaerae]MCW1916387.1 hypothetical protein [Luteolibacter rhizosphaerae]